MASRGSGGNVQVVSGAIGGGYRGRLLGAVVARRKEYEESVANATTFRARPGRLRHAFDGKNCVIDFGRGLGADRNLDGDSSAFTLGRAGRAASKLGRRRSGCRRKTCGTASPRCNSKSSVRCEKRTKVRRSRRGCRGNICGTVSPRSNSTSSMHCGKRGRAQTVISDRRCQPRRERVTRAVDEGAARVYERRTLTGSYPGSDGLSSAVVGRAFDFQTQ